MEAGTRHFGWKGPEFLWGEVEREQGQVQNPTGLSRVTRVNARAMSHMESGTPDVVG